MGGYDNDSFTESVIFWDKMLTRFRHFPSFQMLWIIGIHLVNAQGLVPHIILLTF